MTDSFKQDNKPEYKLNENDQFVIENYNQAKAFSSFYPGIAGKNGIPLWLFYVNRGQCICSMGMQDKENPIMEFLPANWAYQLVTTQGFRTFLKFTDRKDSAFTNRSRITTGMRVNSAGSGWRSPLPIWCWWKKMIHWDCELQ